MAGRSEDSSSDELCERFSGKIEPPVEKGVLKIERYAQRLTQGGSYLWAPGLSPVQKPCIFLQPREKMYTGQLLAILQNLRTFGLTNHLDKSTDERM